MFVSQGPASKLISIKANDVAVQQFRPIMQGWSGMYLNELIDLWTAF